MGRTMYALTVSGGNIFAGTNGGVFLSTNNGTSWTAVNLGLMNPYVNCLAVSGSNIFAGTGGGGVFLSTNNGTSWTAINSGLPANTTVYSLAISSDIIFAGTEGGVFLSPNNGTSWNAANSGLTYTDIRSFAVSRSSIFAGTYGGGVFLSTNNGTSWTVVNAGLPMEQPLQGHYQIVPIFSFVVSGSDIFAGTYGAGVFLYANNGASWIAVNSGLAFSGVNCLAVSGGNIFAGIFSGGIFLSTNNGTNWIEVDSGMPKYPNVECLAVSDSCIFAGIDSTGVWRRSLSEMVSILPQNQQPDPLQTRLRVAASGALHSGVMLNYSIRSRCIVHLGIYAVSGKQVALLEQGERAPGEYAFKFDTGRIPAGFYVCRFQAGSYQESNRLMVVK